MTDNSKRPAFIPLPQNDSEEEWAAFFKTFEAARGKEALDAATLRIARMILEADERMCQRKDNS